MYQKTVQNQEYFYNSFQRINMKNPRQEAYFHLPHKTRFANPTYNSSLVFDSLHVLGNTDFTKGLLKQTEYKDHYANNRKNSIIPSLNYSRRAGPHQMNEITQKQNIETDKNRSYLSTHGAYLLQ